MFQGIDHPAAWPEEKLLAECEISRLRRGGPGGQHRNKVETAVSIKHRPSGVIAEASERRSQEANRQAALFRLRIQLALETSLHSVAGKSEPPASPSTLWKSRTRGRQISINPGHADFPSLLAEALVTLECHSWDAASAADHLECSTSQLVKFLKLEPRALSILNGYRADQGLRPLK